MENNVEALLDLIKKSNDPAQSSTSEIYLEKAYSKIVDLLKNKEDNLLYELSEKAFESENEFLYDQVNSLLLTAIHSHSHYHLGKEYYSSLFVVPYYTSPMNQNVDTISYPPVSQIENVFKKHFFENGLIEDVKQLSIPIVKINHDAAAQMTYSDWHHLHQSSFENISKQDKFDNQYYKYGFAFPLAKEGELNFFPIIITYDESQKPAICHLNNENIDYEKTLQKIENDLSMISANAFCAIGVPTDFQEAIDFGEEIQQDFKLNAFFKEHIQHNNHELVILPLSEGQLALFSWDNSKNKIYTALELFTYSAQEQEIVDYLLEQISFHDIKRTYLFESETDIINIDELNHLSQEKFNELFENNEVIVLEKNNINKPTFH